MPFPTLANGRVDVQVTNILQAYTNPDFVASRFFPIVPGLKDETGKIAGISNSHLRVYDSRRALTDEGEHRMEFNLTNDDSYRVDYYDLEIYLPDRLKDQLQRPFDARRDAGIVLMQALMLEREAALATAITSTAIMTNNTTLSGTSQWNDFANSDPMADIEAARTAIHAKIGREANCMFLSRKAFNTLKRHPQYLAHVAGLKVLSGNALLGLLKDLHELDDVIIGKAIKVTSKEGQTETKAVVWNNDCVLFYRPKVGSLYEPAFGYQFLLENQNVRVDVRRHQNDLGDIVRNMWAYQDKILDVNAAYLIKTVVA